MENQNFILKDPNEILTPREVVSELDKYIIGQDEAKKAVAIALRNRWRRQNVTGAIKDEILPNNIIMIGPTGVGKTEIARRLARLAGAPFIKVEATKFTEIGYVGRDVESMIRDLAERAVAIVREEHTNIISKQARTAAEEKILDLLVPPVKNEVIDENYEVKEIVETQDNSKTREKFRKMLNNGVLDEREIEIEIMVEANAGMQVLGPIGLDDMGINLNDLFGNMMPKKRKTKKMKIVDAIKIIEKEEAEKLIDMDTVVRDALQRAESTGIVFIDEIDKVAGKSTGSSGPEVPREGVQRDLLPIVEGSTVNTKYGPLRTDHVLFIASGAFHVSKPSDLIPELQGRFPIRVELNSLTEEDFIKILTLPENALIKQYTALMQTEGVELTFGADAIKAIASTAAYVNDEVINIGARRLHTILTTLLEDILFNSPDNISEKNIVITEKNVNDKLQVIIQNKDLSKFIL